jgi:hypothetical protein
MATNKVAKSAALLAIFASSMTPWAEEPADLYCEGKAITSVPNKIGVTPGFPAPGMRVTLAADRSSARVQLTSVAPLRIDLVDDGRSYSQGKPPDPASGETVLFTLNQDTLEVRLLHSFGVVTRTFQGTCRIYAPNI